MTSSDHETGSVDLDINDLQTIETYPNGKTSSEKYQEDVETPKKEKIYGPELYFRSSMHEYMFICTSVISQIVNQGGSTQVSTLYNILEKDLNTTATMASWLMASFPIVTGSMILITGQLGDIYGLKKMMLCGYAITFVWSLILGFTKYAHNSIFFIVSRAFQALGVSFILPNIMGTLGRIYQPGSSRKNVVFALVGAGAPVGAFLGVWWAAFIVNFDENAWGWCFWAYAIFSFILFFLSYVFCPNNIPKNTKNIKMDWLGALFALIAMILFNFCWNEAAQVGFQRAYIIVLLIISIMSFFAFFYYEAKFAKYPLLPKSVFTNKSVICVLITLLFGWGSFGIYTFYLFQKFLNVEHLSPLMAGTEFVPLMIFGILAAMIVPLTIKKLTPPGLLVLSAIAFCAGSTMLAINPAHQLYWKLNFPNMIILAFGMDLSFPAASIMLSNHLPSANQGMAGSLISTMVNYALALFLGIGSVVESEIRKHYDKKHPTVSEETKLLKGYRAALYFAVGSAGLAILISSAFLIATILHSRKRQKLEHS